MTDPNHITIDVSEGWYDVLLKAIEFNTEQTDSNVLIARNNTILDKLKRYHYSDGTVRIFRSEYERVFYILLENYLYLSN